MKPPARINRPIVARLVLRVRLPIRMRGARNSAEFQSDTTPAVPVAINMRPSQTTVPATVTTSRSDTRFVPTAMEPQSRFIVGAATEGADLTSASGGCESIRRSYVVIREIISLKLRGAPAFEYELSCRQSYRPSFEIDSSSWRARFGSSCLKNDASERAWSRRPASRYAWPR